MTVFLWPTKQKPSASVCIPLISPQATSVEVGAIPKSFSANLDEEAKEAVEAGRVKEQILQTLLAEIPNNLENPQTLRKLSRDRAILYQRTVGRSAIQVGSLVLSKGRENSEARIKNAHIQRGP